jgi:imidazolonepropionase-like amidohydrolase
LGVILALAMPALSWGETIALMGGTVETLGSAGELKSAVVLIKDGRIAAVGAKLPVPADARVIDVTGKLVTPGLVATVTPLALADLPDIPGADDARSSSSQISAAFDVCPSINPASPLIEEARIEGVTDAILTPGPGIRPNNDTMPFSGLAAAIHLGAATNLVLQDGIAMVLTAGREGAQIDGGSRGAEIALLADVLSRVRLFARNPAAFDENRVRSLNMSRADLEALVPMIHGKIPLLVSVRRASDILSVLDFGKREHLKLILSDVEEGWLVAREIAAAGVPVVIDPEQSIPDSLEAPNVVEDNAARLMRAGVLVAYQPGISRIWVRVRTPRFVAGRTVSRGVSHQAALQAITINPARIFGLDKVFGSIEPGKRADLVVWDGDPLETSSAAVDVFVGGVQQRMTSRHIALRDKYIHTVLPGVGASQ